MKPDNVIGIITRIAHQQRVDEAELTACSQEVLKKHKPGKLQDLVRIIFVTLNVDSGDSRRPDIEYWTGKFKEQYRLVVIQARKRMDPNFVPNVIKRIAYNGKEARATISDEDLTICAKIVLSKYKPGKLIPLVQTIRVMQKTGSCPKYLMEQFQDHYRHIILKSIQEAEDVLQDGDIHPTTI